MYQEQVTIKDIAKKLNLSLSTVSRALRNHPDVSQETRKKVLALAEKLHYEKNPLALSLRNQKTFSIGVVLPEVANSFFSSVLSGIQHVAHEAGYNLLITLSDESAAREQENLKHLWRYRVDGILAAVSKETSSFEHFEAILGKIPIVFFDRIWANPQVSKVTVDDYEGAFTATKHLLAIGCKRIAHIAGPSNLQVTQNRLEGYLAALRQSNLSVDQELIIDGGFSRDFGRQATQQLLALPQRPDAIFCVNDRSAIGCILTLKERQVAIPEEIAVIGFTNSETATIVSPTLSTMAQPTLALGRLSMNLMLKHLNQEDFIPEHQVLKTNLIVRQSTDRTPSS